MPESCWYNLTTAIGAYLIHCWDIGFGGTLEDEIAWAWRDWRPEHTCHNKLAQAASVATVNQVLKDVYVPAMAEQLAAPSVFDRLLPKREPDPNYVPPKPLTVRQLIEVLNNLSEDDKDLPAVSMDYERGDMDIYGVRVEHEYSRPMAILE